MVTFNQYKNFFNQYHHSSYYLNKTGWWCSKLHWGGNSKYIDAPYSKGNGYESAAKYDENLIFRL